MNKFIIASLMFLSSVTSRADVTWLKDLDAAKAEGVKHDKQVLVVFTGSDWCPPCKALHDVVFSSPLFSRVASRYILVELDYPRNKPQSEEIKVKNRNLQQKFYVDGFPTVLLIDSKSGEVFGKKIGFSDKTAKEYVENLLKIKNTSSSRMAIASDNAKSAASMAAFNEMTHQRRVKLDAAIADKNRVLAEQIIDDIYATGGGRTNPRYWFKMADVLLMIDPFAREEIAKHFEMAEKLAISKNDKEFASFLEKKRSKFVTKK